MPVSDADFTGRFPEFGPTDLTQRGAALAGAESLVSQAIPTAKRDKMVMLTAAVELTSGTQGRHARSSEDGQASSTYQRQLDELKATNALGRRVR